MPKRTSDLNQEIPDKWQIRRTRVGARIRELRLAAGLTQESLALEADMTRNTLIGIEWGKRSVGYERLFDIADALGCEVSALFELPVEAPTRVPYRGGSRPRLRSRNPGE